MELGSILSGIMVAISGLLVGALVGKLFFPGKDNKEKNVFPLPKPNFYKGETKVSEAVKNVKVDNLKELRSETDRELVKRFIKARKERNEKEDH